MSAVAGDGAASGQPIRRRRKRGGRVSQTFDYKQRKARRVARQKNLLKAFIPNNEGLACTDSGEDNSVILETIDQCVWQVTQAMMKMILQWTLTLRTAKASSYFAN